MTAPELSAAPAPDPALTAEIVRGTRLAVQQLHDEHPGPFCVYALATSGEALRPYLIVTPDDATRWDLPDSPFAVYGDEHLAGLEEPLHGAWRSLRHVCRAGPGRVRPPTGIDGGGPPSPRRRRSLRGGGRPGRCSAPRDDDAAGRDRCGERATSQPGQPAPGSLARRGRGGRVGRALTPRGSSLGDQRGAGEALATPVARRAHARAQPRDKLSAKHSEDRLAVSRPGPRALPPSRPRVTRTEH